MQQINTWPQYERWLVRKNLAWHCQAGRFVKWAKSGETQGAGHARSHYCARRAMDGGLRFGRAMRRWLSSPVTNFPPGWRGPREPGGLDYI
jgi:hypothetical protein